MKFTTDAGDIRFASNFKAPVQLVVGAYYEEEWFHWDGDVIHANPETGIVPCYSYAACVAAGLHQPGLYVTPVIFAQSDEFDVNQYAVYGQADWKILSNLTLTVGARYFSAKLRDLEETQQDVFPGGYFIGQITVPYISSQSSTTEGKTTYNFALLWKPTDNISAYVRAASGFRIGGINGSATIAAQQGIVVPVSYGPDSLWDYEAGVKAWFLQHRLFIDAAYYHIDWANQQQLGIAAGTWPYTLNAGLTRIDGVELSTIVRPAEGLSIGGDITWVHAVLGQDLPANVVDGGTPGLAGDRLPFIPKLSISGNAEYEHPLSSAVRGYVQGDFVYHSGYATTFRPTSAAQLAAGIPDDYYRQLGSYFLLDLAAGVRFNRYDVSVYAENATDNRSAPLGAVSTNAGLWITTPRPLTVGIRVRAQFP